MEGNDWKRGDELGGYAEIQVREMKTQTWEIAMVKSGQILGILTDWFYGLIESSRMSLRALGFNTWKDGIVIT